MLRTKQQKAQAWAFLAGVLFTVMAPDMFNQTFGKLLKKNIQVGE
tara:strand:- start:966 stop:1100 length:135 start_codon:yes stop_codon:yes gene_type:complete